LITKQDLLEAVAECQGTRDPNANTAIKLAAYYTILDHLDDDKPKIEPVQTMSYSYAAPSEGIIEYDGESEFAQVIDGKPQREVLKVLDELLAILQATNERLYNAVMRKLDAT